MAVPDDPQEVAARFWAQLLGYEIVEGGPEPGSPVWGMELVRRLALAPPVTPDVAQRLIGEYVRGRWHYCYPELDEIWEHPPPPRNRPPHHDPLQ